MATTANGGALIRRSRVRGLPTPTWRAMSSTNYLNRLTTVLTTTVNGRGLLIRAAVGGGLVAPRGDVAGRFLKQCVQCGLLGGVQPGQGALFARDEGTFDVGKSAHPGRCQGHGVAAAGSGGAAALGEAGALGLA